MVMTGFSIGLDAFHGVQLWGELFEVPLMAAMFLAMVWHARRRVEAQRIAEGRAEEHRSLLESQERFIHDASHELRTPVTIARGHLELLQSAIRDPPEVEVALDELGRMDAIVARLLVLAVADEPDFLQTRRDRAGAAPGGRVHALVGAGAAGLAAGPAGVRAPARRRRPPARGPGCAAGERGQVLAPGSGDRTARDAAGTRRGGDRGGGRGLRGAARRRCRGSSIASRGPTRRARAPRAASGSAWPSPTPSPRPTAAVAA